MNLIRLFSVIFLMISVGCQTTTTSRVPYKNEYSKYVNNLAVLSYAETPEMSVSIRNDGRFFASLAAGPAIIPQILMQLAYNSAQQEDIRAFNDMIFDVNIGELLCKKLNTKFQLCSYFHVVPQEGIRKNKVVWELLEKKEKNIEDYQKIGTELGVDTLLEVNVISYGLKDPGVFSDPYVFLTVEVKMTTATEGIVLFREVIEGKVATDALEVIDTVYDEGIQHLKEELEAVADVVSEKCIEGLGFDTNYTYLLEEDYIEKTRNKVNIAEKLRELNTLRHENLITNTDYDETRLNLIEKAKR